MKILFLKDVRPTARAGDVKEVKNGFARNFLIPQGFAVQATEHELRRASKLRAQAEDRRLVEAKEWQDVADVLKDQKVRIEMTDREIDRKGIQSPAPIRAVGDYKVPARFVEGVSAIIVVEVVADDASIELNKQMEEAVSQMTEEDTNVLDPSFEDVLAAAEADIDAAAKDGSEVESEDDEAESSEEASDDSSDDDADDSEENSEE